MEVALGLWLLVSKRMPAATFSQRNERCGSGNHGKQLLTDRSCDNHIFWGVLILSMLKCNQVMLCSFIAICSIAPIKTVLLIRVGH